MAFVIGASGGIGASIVRRLLQDSFSVCATYAHENKKIDHWRQEFQEKPISFHQLDFLNETDAPNVLRGIVQKYPRIDVVVFTPSLPLSHDTLLDSTWTDFEKHFYVQVRGMWCVVKALEEQIKERYGIKFVIMLSEACIGKPPVRLAPYVSAKYSLLGLAKVMAIELAAFSCTVNCISPGMVETQLLNSFPQKMIELTKLQNPLKRIATPQDVANVVAFLSSDQSDYLNGAHITINGGSVFL